MVDGLVGWLVGEFFGWLVWFGFVWFDFLCRFGLLGLVGWLVGLLVGWASESFQKLPKLVQDLVQNRSKINTLCVPEALGAQDGPKRDFN